MRRATSSPFRPAQTAAAGTPVVIDLSQQQRVLVTDAATGAEVGASFLAAASPTPITFTGSAPGGPLLASLAGLLPSGDSVMSGWTCSTAGYASGQLRLSLICRNRQRRRILPGRPGGLELQRQARVVGVSATISTYDGTFASFTVASLGSFALTGVAVMPGDANRDGHVDVNDLTIVLANYGHTGLTWTQGDFTGDGRVDFNDLTIVLTNYNATYGASSAVSAVPEPSGVALVGIGAASLLAFAWRKRRAS